MTDLKKADHYAQFALAAASRAKYLREVQYYKTFCIEIGASPTISLDPVLLCLGKKAKDGVGTHSLEALVSALKYWSRGMPERDILYLPQIADLIEGHSKEHKPLRKPRFDNAQILRMSSSLGEAPLDLRDRSMIVMCHCGMLTLAGLRSLMRGDVTSLTSVEEIIVRVCKPRERFLRFSLASQPLLCPVRTLRAWLSVRGPRIDGHVYIGRGQRGDWLDLPVNHFLINRAMSRAARLAGLSDAIASTRRMRCSAIRIAAKSMQPVPLAYALGFRSPYALKTYGLKLSLKSDSRQRAFQKEVRRWRR